MEEEHDIAFLLVQRFDGVCVRAQCERLEVGKQVRQESVVRLNPADDVGLIVEDEPVQDTECRVVKYTGEDNILEVEDSIRLVDFVKDSLVLDGNNLPKAGYILKELSIRGFQAGEFRVIYPLAYALGMI